MSGISKGSRPLSFVCVALMIVAVVEVAACVCIPPIGIAAARFKIRIDGNSAVQELMPIPPKMPTAGNVVLPRDLASVPEIQFESVDAATRDKAAERIARQLAAINYLNEKKTDHFMEELLRHRPDLAGLPFALGDACRHDRAHARKFSVALVMVKMPIVFGSAPDPAAFWKDFDEMTQRVHGDFKKNSDTAPYVPENRHIIAALMQIFTGQAPDWQVSLAKRLPSFDASDADKQAVTEALVSLAVFAPDRDVREEAQKSLTGRDTKNADAILRRGLRYPWPDVARNAADLVVQLRRTDLADELKQMLSEPDPRAPVMQKVDGKNVPVVRELVRVNHLRNCMLCHPAVNAPDFLQDRSDTAKIGHVFLSGTVPIPGTQVPTDYTVLAPPVDLLVRADATYLRQDFSRLERVPDAAPWPEMQRFDFLVRNRVVSAEEKAKFDGLFPVAENEYRAIARSALRRLNK
jgi:hypothetical protein